MKYDMQRSRDRGVPVAFFDYRGSKSRFFAILSKRGSLFR